MSFVGRAPSYTRPDYEAPPTPEPGAGDWPNAYAWRQDIVLSPAEAAVSNFILPLVLDLTGITERSDGGDIRIEVAGSPRPYELAAYDDTSKIAHVWVRLADYPTGSALTVRVYAGKDDAAGEADASACYAGYLQVIDGATGLDLTGQGRSVTPNGVVAGTFSNGWPCGVYDGADVMSSAAASAWIEGLSALSMQAIVDGGGQAITGAVLAHSALPEGTSGGNDNAVLSWIPETSGGVPSVWHMKTQTSPDNSTAYTLGAANTATPGLAVLHATWESGDSPDLYVDGALIGTSAEVPRTGTTRRISDGYHVGGNFIGKIGQLRVADFVVSPLRAALEARAFLTPLALLGRGAWYGPDDEGNPPVIANPVAASATAGVAQDIDVVAASSKPGSATIDSVTQGTRGAVSIASGQARYTASGTEAGVDAFAFTLSDGTFLSTSRCEVVIAGAASGGGGDELPAPLSEVTLNDQAAFDAWKAGPPPPGQHATCTFNVNLGTISFSGTENNPIVIKADGILSRAVTGGTIGGSYVRLYGFNFGARTFDLAGNGIQFIRSKFVATVGNGGSVLRFRGRYGTVRSTEFDGTGATGRAIAFDTGADGRDGWVERCWFHDWAPGAGNASETITAGFTNQRTGVETNLLIDLCLFQRCNDGGQEDETIALKCSKATVRKCTFDRTRYLNVRHGTDHTIAEIVHKNSPTGGIAILDHNITVTSCKTSGGSRMRIFAGNTPSGAENITWYNLSVNSPTGKYPRAHDCKIYHHEAIGTAPEVGVQFSQAFDPLYKATGTTWLQNRGLDPVHNTALSTGLATAGTAPIAYVAPVELTAVDVGPGS